MSLAAMCKNCNYCCSINSTSVAFGNVVLQEVLDISIATAVERLCA